MLKYSRLKELLSYNENTGIFIWKIANSRRIHIGDVAGSKSKVSGYVEIGIDGKIYLAHRLAWFYIYGYLPENKIDHRDRIKHHNWLDNIREVSQSCNLKNTGNFSHNTSGVKGVCFHKKQHKWFAQLKNKQKTKNLGLYSHFEDAVCARLAGEQCLGWSGCDDHSPAFLYVKINIQGYV